jgi:CheY-like chemotaxis protein
MPIVDGYESTRLIRAHEKARPANTRINLAFGRVPIFAVSGGLREDELQKYIDASFDGWMPKPINMARLGIYLAGALDKDMRDLGRYDPAHFEYGGWFGV